MTKEIKVNFSNEEPKTTPDIDLNKKEEPKTLKTFNTNSTMISIYAVVLILIGLITGLAIMNSFSDNTVALATQSIEKSQKNIDYLRDVIVRANSGITIEAKSIEKNRDILAKRNLIYMK